MLGYRGVDDEPLMSENDGYDKWVRELAASGASLPEIAAKLAEAAKARTESHASSKLTVNKITWAQVGLVTEPGRHMCKLGWLTITADDLTVWKQYPGASFTLCSMAAPRQPAIKRTRKRQRNFVLGYSICAFNVTVRLSRDRLSAVFFAWFSAHLRTGLLRTQNWYANKRLIQIRNDLPGLLKLVP
jgi:hypothetical protein